MKHTTELIFFNSWFTTETKLSIPVRGSCRNKREPLGRHKGQPERLRLKPPPRQEGRANPTLRRNRATALELSSACLAPKGFGFQCGRFLLQRQRGRTLALLALWRSGPRSLGADLPPSSFEAGRKRWSSLDSPRRRCGARCAGFPRVLGAWVQQNALRGS